eukprot:SAG31_NODE_11734_length_1002_cov_1.232558_1_plen_95_part_00
MPPSASSHADILILLPKGVPSLHLNTGVAMPTLGLGTFQATAPGEVGAAVTAAVKAVRLGCSFLVVVCNYSRNAGIIERYTALIEKVSSFMATA